MKIIFNLFFWFTIFNLFFWFTFFNIVSFNFIIIINAFKKIIFIFLKYYSKKITFRILVNKFIVHWTFMIIIYHFLDNLFDIFSFVLLYSFCMEPIWILNISVEVKKKHSFKGLNLVLIVQNLSIPSNINNAQSNIFDCFGH